MRHLLLCSLSALLIVGCDHPSNSTTTSAASASGSTAAAASTAPAASSAATASPPPAPSPADPQDAKLGAFEKEVAQAIVNAATGGKVDAKWISKSPDKSVSKLTDPDDKKLIDLLGKDLSIVLVEMELGEIAQPTPNEYHEVNARAIMLTDGTVRWGTVGARSATQGELSSPTPGIDKSAPVVVDAGKRLIKALSSDCKLPWLAPADVAQIHEGLHADLITDMTHTQGSCAEVAKVKGEWRTHIDDIRVLVKGNGHYGFLSSVFDVEEPGERLVLAPLHAEVVEDKSLKK